MSTSGRSENTESKVVTPLSNSPTSGLDASQKSDHNEAFKSKDNENNNDVRAYEEFEDMGLKPDLLRGIFGYGFEKPSAIQQRAIVPCLNRNDVIAQAQSGSGKTATFGISVLQNADLSRKENQVIVLAPTRELALQHTTVLRCLGEFLTDLQVHTSVGGIPTRQEIQILRKNVPQIIVGTPGRVADMLNRGEIRAEEVQMMVLDEADVMLDKGFTDQVYGIFRELPGEMQVVLTSATLPPEVLELTRKFMRNPTQILVKNENLTLDGIRQYYIDCGEVNRNNAISIKAQTVAYLYEQINVTQSVIFVNSRRIADRLGEDLASQDFMCSIIHADLSFEERRTIMSCFKSGSTRVLISTDLLARGIDVQQVNLVVNFDLPLDRETYIHRIGRSGRFGRKGVAINLACGQYDMRKVRELEMFYSTRILELTNDDVADYLN